MKALDLLKNPLAEYDTDHALMLARTCNFQDGILYLYQKTGLYREIITYYIDINNIEMIMESCRRFSNQEPSVWIQALIYCASHEECKERISEVLKHIEEQHLLQPLVVVQLLASNRYATLADIKDYIVRHLEEQNDSISKSEGQIKEYGESTNQMKDEISQLQRKARVYQVRKCNQCNRGLTLPAVHFLCQHSYHQTCLEDEYENECPTCARENRKVLDIIQRQEQSTDLHETFHAQLGRAPDGFSVVADYFGRGVFSDAMKQVR